MVVEMCVGIMALIAACAMQPGEYFAINMAGPATTVVSKISALGYPVTGAQMADLAASVGEKTMIGRTGGAPTFAVGMAHVFANALGNKSLMPLWYHFAIMFEALFILTTVDAGTRVGRFLLQDLLGHIWKPLGNTSSYVSNIVASVMFVSAWGWFLYQGVVDPLGGIKTLWPIFGVANQLLAVIALCLGTTVIVKMGRARYLWVTLAPLLFLLTATMTAGWQKIFSKSAAGFIPGTETLLKQLQTTGVAPGDAVTIQKQIFNNTVDIVVMAVFMTLVALIVLSNARLWWRLLVDKAPAVLHEDEPIMISDPRIKVPPKGTHSY